MLTSSDYLKGKKLQDFRATEIFMLRGKSAKGVENLDNVKAPIRGLVLDLNRVYKVGPEYGKVNRECAHYLVKSGAALPKPNGDDKQLVEDYKARVAAGKKCLAIFEAAEKTSLARKTALADPLIDAKIKAATEEILNDHAKGAEAKK